MQMKKLLLLGVLVLALFFVAVAGTTYALQSAEVFSGTGTFRPGTMDAKVYWSKDLKTWYDAESDNGIFTNTIWEPNYAQLRYIKIANAGDIEFKYTLSFENVSGELANVIEVYCGDAPAQPFTTLDQLTSATKCMGTLASLENGIVLEGALLASHQQHTTYTSGEDIFVIALHMQESADNSYQGTTLESFNLNLHATQFDYDGILGLS